MTKRDLNDIELDLLFDAGRRADPDTAPDFMARISADAVAAAGAALTSDRPVHAAPTPRGLMARLGDLLGGLALPGSVVTAGIVGVWIGAAAPVGVPDVAEIWTGADLSVLIEDDWFGVDADDDTLWEDG